MEWYAASILRETRDAIDSKNIWLDWDGEVAVTKTRVRKPDAVLREGSTLFFIEVTTSTVVPQVASSGDPDILEQAIKDIWFPNKPGSSGKLRQLADAIDAFRTDLLKIDGVDPKEITRIRPVLVTLRDFPCWPRLMEWYRALMKEGGMTDEFIADVVLIDIEELEDLAHELHLDHTWTSILAQKALSLVPDLSMHNFLTSVGRAQERHPFVLRSLQEAAASFEGRVFTS